MNDYKSPNMATASRRHNGWLAGGRYFCDGREVRTRLYSDSSGVAVDKDHLMSDVEKEQFGSIFFHDDCILSQGDFEDYVYASLADLVSWFDGSVRIKQNTPRMQLQVVWCDGLCRNLRIRNRGAISTPGQ